jgi:hypothetical protein
MRAILIAAVAMAMAGGHRALPAGAESPPTRAEVEAGMGLRSEGDLVRGQLDTVGFPVTAEQAEEVVSTALRLEGMAGASAGAPLVGGICPHDDHHWVGYAAVGYSLAGGPP